MDYELRKLTGETIYLDFCVWCNAFNKSKGKNDASLFSKFLKEQKIELNFWQKKYLSEKYFGFVYDYNYAEKKWKIKKVS